MFNKIADGITYPPWVNQESQDPGQRRYKRLDLRDRLLDGTFYDHLKHAFYDERDQAQNIIKLVERRPSSQYRLCRMVARWCSRKLFAGRHIPKLKHPDDGKTKALAKLLRRCQFFERMKETVLLGSVGAVAVTFRVDDEDPEDPQVALTVWRAKYCKPSFDPMRELSQLRVNYQTTGAAFIADGYPAGTAGTLEEIKPNAIYWFIRDFTPQGETTYKPIKQSEWNPVEGFTGEGAAGRKLEPWPERVYPHTLQFVCGHWFRNLPGGHGDDGACTFEDAIPNSIELDYTFSQLGRGVRYNSAPTPVIIGDMLNDYTQGTLSHINVSAGYKEAEGGQTIGAGDAKLLEMKGEGVKAALELIDKLRNLALEAIAASRKDPDKMHAPLSGRAMEYLDQDSDDLVSDLRSQYGEGGAVPLIRKIAVAAGIMDADVGSLRLQWPRQVQPTPDEVFALVQALVLALDPMKKSSPATPGTPAKKPASAQGAYTAATPGTPAVSPTEDEQLLTIEEARAYLRLNLDLDMIDLDEEHDAEDEADPSPTPPNKPTPSAPPALPADVVPPDPGEGDEPQDDDELAGAPQGSFGGSVTVDA